MGATAATKPAASWIEISIHAPAMGATPGTGELFRASRYFNPRARDGRDENVLPRRSPRSNFNPRARDGRDYLREHARSGLPHFNPRARDGRDESSPSRMRQSRQFQSTRPRWARRYFFLLSRRQKHFNPRARDGRDPILSAPIAFMADFNPRARDGRDTFPDTTSEYARISIHAPAMGATNARRIFWGGAVISIHAPAMGATCSMTGSYTSVSISIHAPAMGATASRLMFWPSCPFQSTRPRWARLCR